MCPINELITRLDSSWHSLSLGKLFDIHIATNKDIGESCKIYFFINMYMKLNLILDFKYSNVYWFDFRLYLGSFQEIEVFNP